VDNKREISIKKILSVGKIEYIKWICDPRMILFFSMNIFVYDYVTKILIENSQKMGKPLNIVEPFIAICNSEILLFVMPIVFLALISDYPKTDGNSMFYMLRTGKRNWLIGQMLFAFMAAVTYVSSIFIITCLCCARHSYIYNQWSYVVRRYAITFPNESNNIMLNLIPDRLYNNLTPGQALLHTFALLILIMLLIAFVQLISFVYNRKMIGLLTNMSLLCIGIGSQMFAGAFKWIFPVSNALVWMHYDPIFKKRIVPIKNSYLYFIILIAVLMVWSIVTVKRYDFSKVEDLED